MVISSNWNVIMKERSSGLVLTETLLEFEALEGRVELVVRSQQVVGHQMSTFFH